MRVCCCARIALSLQRPLHPLVPSVSSYLPAAAMQPRMARPIARVAHAAAQATGLRHMASSSTAAAASAAPAAPAQPAQWGPRSRLLAPSLPAPLPRRSAPVDGVAPTVRPLPLKYARLTNDQPNSKTEQYDLLAAVVVERWPKVMREEEEWRTEYREHFKEVHARKQQKHAIPSTLQAQQPEDAAATASFSSAPVDPSDLLTEADHANDLHATHRCLQDSLFLVVKRRGGGWMFPSSQIPFDVLGWDTHVPDAAAILAAATVKEATALLAPPPPKDTLRTVAATAISGSIGTHAGVYFMGNAPIAVHRVTKAPGNNGKAVPAAVAGTPAHPGPVTVGTKTFFMHALFMDGEIRLQNTRELEDYAWIKKEEIAKYVGQEQAAILDVVLLSPSM